MSKSIPPVQLDCTMKCNLCDSEENVHSFCKNCRLQNLCDNCKELHQKILSIRSHDIGSIDDGRQTNQSEDLLCLDHAEILTHYCKTCSMNFWPKCLSNYLNHDLFDEEGQRMKQELEKTMETKSNLLEEILKSREEMLRHRARFDSTEEDVILKIDAEFDMIMRLKLEFEDAIIRKNARDREKIREHNYVLQNYKSKLEEEMRRIKEDLHDYSGLSLIKFAQSKLEKLNAIDTPSSDTEQSRSDIKLSEMYFFILTSVAEMMRNDIGQVLFSENLITLSSFRLKSNIWDIVYEKKDKVWVSCDGEREMKKVDREGNVHQRIQMVPNSIFLATARNGDVFISSCNALPIETKIRKFDSVGNIYQFARLTDFDVIYNIALDNHGFLFCHVGQSNVNFILKLDVKGETKWERELGNQCFSVSSITFSPQNICYIA